MRIAVVGTSNSIGTGGYVSGMQESGKVHSIENFSLGHSTSVVLPMIKKKIDFSSFDFCIFDFVVNEEVQLKNILEISLINDLLVDFISGMENTRCIPVILIMPSHLGLGEMKPARAFYTDFARRHGVPFFDFYIHLENLAHYSKLSVKSLFRDPDHLDRWAASAFGFKLAEILASRLSKHVEKIFSEKDGMLFDYMDFSSLQLGTPTITRESSVLKVELQILRGKQTIQVPIQKGSQIIGIALNLGNTNALITLTSGSSRARYDFGDRYLLADDERPVFVVRPIVPFTLDETLQIGIQPPTKGGDRPPILEIGGLTIRRSIGKQNELSTNDKDIDLALAISDADVRFAAMLGNRLSNVRIALQREMTENAKQESN